MPDPAARPSPISRPLATRLVYLLGVAAVVATLVLTRSSGSTAPPAALDLHTASAAVQVGPPEITVTGAGEVYGPRTPSTSRWTLPARRPTPAMPSARTRARRIL